MSAIQISDIPKLEASLWNDTAELELDKDNFKICLVTWFNMSSSWEVKVDNSMKFWTN